MHDSNINHFIYCNYGVLSWIVEENIFTPSFMSEYFLIWQKVLEELGQASNTYFCLQVQVRTKYLLYLEDRVEINTKYCIFCIKYQI